MASANLPQRTLERPRLVALLHTSSARVVLLSAPAGYGKTTLARQWIVATDQTIWFRATPSSRDVAALALALGRSVSTVAPEAASATRRHVMGLTNPALCAEELAETLSASFGEAARETCVVFDDYDRIAASGAAELFVQVLTELAPVRFLIAARRRPRWVSARKILYGDVFEIDATQLALTLEETTSILVGINKHEARNLWERTRGWPAVIALAARTANTWVPEGALPPALHEYFAEELYQSASPSVREALQRLAVLPTLIPAFVEVAVDGLPEDVCHEAAELGFLSGDSDGNLELHPLLQAFLASKLDDAPDRRFVYRIIERAMEEGCWDEAFAVVDRFAVFHILPRLLERALDPLLEDNRLATLKTWLEAARRHDVGHPLFGLAEAEVLRRTGPLELGEAQALDAAQRGRCESWVSRAYAVAGECAQLDSRPTAAMRHQQRAEKLANTPTDARRALWGRFVIAAQLEDNEATKLLERFTNLSDGSSNTALRIACGHLILAITRGGLDDVVKLQHHRLPLISSADDPLITTSFLYRIAYTNVLSGRYRIGARLAQQADAEARSARLRFAAAHIGAAQAAAAVGLRQMKRAQLLLDRVVSLAQELDDRFELANARLVHARILLAGTSPDLAATHLALEEPRLPKALEGEWIALRALALAVSGEGREAEELAVAAMTLTREVQAQTLAHLASAVIALKQSARDVDECLTRAEETLLNGQNYDSLVCAYRAYPRLLHALRERGRIPNDRLLELVTEAHDQRLAAVGGWLIPAVAPAGTSLSHREREVLALLSQGLTNREIANELVISEMTVKVHVRHILEKLGVRSRTEAALLVQETA